MTAVLIADSTRSEVPIIIMASAAASSANAITAMLAAQKHTRTSPILNMFHCLFLLAIPSAAPSVPSAGISMTLKRVPSIIMP